VVNWEVGYTKEPQRDAEKFACAGLELRAERLLDILRSNLRDHPHVDSLRVADDPAIGADIGGRMLYMVIEHFHDGQSIPLIEFPSKPAGHWVQDYCLCQSPGPYCSIALEF
jgi:hypothetical protein